MGRRRLRMRGAVGALAAVLAAGLLVGGVVAPVSARSDGRAFPADSTDIWSRVLFGGLADVARVGTGRRDLAGIVQQASPSGRQIAVTVTFSDAAVADSVAAAGLRIANRRGTMLEGYVSESNLGRMALTSGVVSVAPIRRHLVDAFTGAEVALHHADAWQAAGFTGQDVKIGVIDGGFQGIAALLGTELPATIQARCYTAVGTFSTKLTDCNNGQDHGTGVAEAAVDMAPGVSLYVADPISFLDGQSVITWMTSQGVRIINASYSSGLLFEGPGDGTTSLKGTTYDDVNLATSKGALWVNSAGNHGEGGFVGPWSDTDANGFLEFAPGDENETLHLHEGQDLRIAIRWAEPWGKATANYNVAIYVHGDGNPLDSGSPIASGVPMRIMDFTAPLAGDYDISIKRISGTATPRIQLLVASEFEFVMTHPVVADTLPSPADSASPLMLSVGAADVNAPTAVEAFSSQGPTLDNRTKPDIVGADCVDTIAIPEFCGTSEAAPFVTGGAALVLGANPTFTTADIIAYLKGHATPMGPGPNNAAGWGLMNLGPVPPPPPGVAKGLSFQTQPVGGPATVPLATQPVVRIVDANDATVTGSAAATAPVTLALGINPGAATLTCTGGLTKPAVAGFATFAGCRVSAPGSGYTLAASSGNLVAATSLPFDVGPAPPPVPLVFVATPASGPANTPLIPAPSVKVADPQGNPVTTGPDASAPITLALGTNPSAGSLFCSGGLTVTAVAGIATFNGCRISAAGDGYTLVATSPGLVDAMSGPISMTTAVEGPAILVTPGATAITWGDAINLAVRLTAPAGTTVALTGREVRVQASADNHTWIPIGDVTVDVAGVATLSYRPVMNLWYRVVFDGATDLGGAVSAAARVTVRQLIALRPGNHGTVETVKTVKQGEAVAFTITVRPARANLLPGRVTIEIYQKLGSGWRRTAVETGQPNASGQIVFTVTFGTTTGLRYVRATAGPTAVNANSAWTSPQFYRVR